MQVSRYHKLLRIALLVIAVVLIFDGGFLIPITQQFSDNTMVYLGSVGTSDVSEDFETNSLNAEASGDNYSTYMLSALLSLVISLLLINYMVHWIRARARTKSSQQVHT